ncbi:FAD-dependent oxidoreductase [Catenovulum sediminis]|uniref:FAD-dependent oxidoreductase n=1 Tax=Catenovulum sediminis TaxID=1740262 RepID=UPI00117CD94F|nr:NADPH-dependent 2,4-dienoyl-CoA reductase [Catenovulum sediminis]
MHYPHLFRSLELKHGFLKNRIVMGSMHTNLEEQKKGFDKLAVFYKERAQAGVGLIVTGGISPNEEGVLAPGQAQMRLPEDVANHRLVTSAVHQVGGKICMQLLHAGRYGFHQNIVAPSALQASINRYTPRELTPEEIEKQIDDFVHSARLAQQAGYDGIEIMGSEGYLINQFIVLRTNQRTDAWGGDYINRCRFALEIIRRIRSVVSRDFIVIYRLSMLDLVEGGSSREEVLSLAQWVEQAGVDILNTGIGWHEARVPTIAAMVPRGAFSQITKIVKQVVNIPVMTSNRINMPATAEQILLEDKADLISMARPFLADSEWVEKARNGQDNSINTCIACNQACLDKVFAGEVASCLVNPRAARETQLNFQLAKQQKKILVVGGGVAGMAFAKYAAQRGHKVCLVEKQAQLGGQLNYAKQIPGKSEFNETLRYFATQLAQLKVELKLNTDAQNIDLRSYDEIILATGVEARIPAIKGIEQAIQSKKAVTYAQLLAGEVKLANSLAIIGAGGIGIDVAVYACEANMQDENPYAQYYQNWGIDINLHHRAGMMLPQHNTVKRHIYLLQRKAEVIGKNLAKTTGWIHKSVLKKQGVKQISGVTYKKIDDQGLHIEQGGETQVLAVEQIVLCAGQTSNNFKQLVQEKTGRAENIHLIGGAFEAKELDAEAAIYQAALLAQKI